MNSLEEPRQQKMGMRFATRNITSPYRAGSLKKAASELAKYNLDLEAVYFLCNGYANYHLETCFFSS
jgi:hypothetical protein